MKRRRPTGVILIAIAAVIAVLGLAQAASPDRAATQQERVDDVAATIRCPTCQGLSIKDSPSVLAGGSRQIVEQQLRAGRTPDQVRQYFVDRYGASALLSPDPAGPGLLAWVVPAAALPLVAALGWRRLRRPAAAAAGPSEEAAATALASYRDGALQPDSSAAGELLREALQARLALDEDGLEDAQLRASADRRVAAAARRYARRPTTGQQPQGPPSRRRALPRGVVTAVAVVAVAGAASGALAVGVRDRGAGDLPTGDLPGAAAAPETAPGLNELVGATQRAPDDPQAWTALGQAYDAAQQWVPALEAYDRALSLGPADDDVVALLRASLLVRAGSPAEALPVLQQLAQRRPEDPQVLLVLGLAQQSVGTPEASATLQRFLQLAPDAPAAEMVRQLLGEQ